jgi:hypothetical protein
MKSQWTILVSLNPTKYLKILESNIDHNIHVCTLKHSDVIQHRTYYICNINDLTCLSRRNHLILFKITYSNLNKWSNLIQIDKKSTNTELADKIYSTGKIPERMKEFIVIPKREDAVECGKHRTISFMSQVAMIVLKTRKCP